MISNRLKKLIVEYLLKDLMPVEIIYYKDSIWFIDREQKYWYFEYHKVDKHLWWRWSHFQSALTMFSLNGEEHQYLFGELVNIILNKKQKLETKYPDKVFKTVGSVLNFKEESKEVLNSEVNKTGVRYFNGEWRVEEVLNNQIKTTNFFDFTKIIEMEEVLNFEVETTTDYAWYGRVQVDKVLNNEVEITQSTFFGDTHEVIDEVLDYKVEKTYGVFYNDEIVTQGVLDLDVKINGDELDEENEMMNKVLEIQNIQPTERGTSNMVDFVLDVEDYTAWDGKIKHQVSEVITQSPKLIEKQYDIDVVLDNTVEINSIERMKGESSFQDIVVSHILDESEKVTDKLKIKEDDRVKSYGCDVFICDFLVQNVLDIGSNSINFDVTSQQGRVDGVLKNS